MALTNLNAVFKDSTGGVKNISFCKKDDFPASVSISSGSISSSLALQNAAAWLTMNFEEYSADASWELKDKEGRNYIETKIEAFASGLHASTIMQWLRDIAATSGIICAIEYFNGEKLIFGWDTKIGTDGFLRISSVKGSAGKLPSDKVGFDILLHGMQKETPFAWTSLA